MAFLIAVEGIDGSGKGTQSQRLVEALQRKGVRASLVSFPRYAATRYGGKIGDFLNGRFGQLHEVHPVLVSLLFAGDRFESRDFLFEQLASHDVVVCDRYVSSNVAHQGAKAVAAEQDELRAWIEFVEYDQHRLPHADLTIWLDIPVDVAQRWIHAKQQRDYTERAADLQEADAAYLQKVRELYARLAADDPNWKSVCVMDAAGQPRAIEELGSELEQIVGSAISSRAQQHCSQQ